MLAKASGLPADEVVIDLEDAVAASAKDEARAVVVGALADGRLGGRMVAVRINGLDTPWCHRDIVALADGPAAGAVTSLVIRRCRHPRMSLGSRGCSTWSVPPGERSACRL
jgi:citrate lyase beta subunit